MHIKKHAHTHTNKQEDAHTQTGTLRTQTQEIHAHTNTFHKCSHTSLVESSSVSITRVTNSSDSCTPMVGT